MRFPITRHRLPQLVADLAIVVVAWFLAFQLRFDPDIPVFFDRYYDFEVFALLVAIKLSVFALFGFYNRWWRYVSTRDMWGALPRRLGGVARRLPRLQLLRDPRVDVPRGIWVIDWLSDLALRGRVAHARPHDHRAAAGLGRSSPAARRSSSSARATRRS